MEKENPHHQLSQQPEGMLNERIGGTTLAPPAFQLNAGRATASPIQARLIDAGTLGATQGNPKRGSALAVYHQIVAAIRKYNAEEQPQDCIEQLARLAELDELMEHFKQKNSGTGSSGDQPGLDTAIENIPRIRISIDIERGQVLQQKTESHPILPGKTGLLRSGVPWEINMKNQWQGTDGLIRPQETFRVTIHKMSADRQSAEFTFLYAGTTYKGRGPMTSIDMDARFVARADPLFPQGKPLPEEVRQTQLGDCFLQAALASLAAKDPAKITEMIQDLGTEVVVRLFKTVKDVATPVYIRVDKSVVENRNGAGMYNDGALWVKMIQKAYAFSGLNKGIVGKEVTAYPDIAGHLPGYAFNVLTGGNARELKLEKEENNEDNFPWGTHINTYADFRSYNELPEKDETEDFKEYQLADQQLKRIFPSTNQALIDAWAEFAKEHAPALEGQRSMEGIAHFLRTNGLGEHVVRPMLAWLQTSGLLPGAVGSGIYSTAQLDYFKRIAAQINSGAPMVASTKSKLSSEDTTETGPSGEPISKGLAGSHAYSLLDVRANASKNPESKENGPYNWLQLRNPWGYYGRAYNTSHSRWKFEVIEKNDGVFWIELSDFCENFRFSNTP